MKVRSSRGETQRIEPQPRQSGDWRSREGALFFGADWQNLAKELPSEPFAKVLEWFNFTESGIAFIPQRKEIVQNDSPDFVAIYPILLREALQ